MFDALTNTPYNYRDKAPFRYTPVRKTKIKMIWRRRKRIYCTFKVGKLTIISLGSLAKFAPVWKYVCLVSNVKCFHLTNFMPFLTFTLGVLLILTGHCIFSRHKLIGQHTKFQSYLTPPLSLLQITSQIFDVNHQTQKSIINFWQVCITQ